MCLAHSVHGVVAALLTVYHPGNCGSFTFTSGGDILLVGCMCIQHSSIVSQKRIVAGVLILCVYLDTVFVVPLQ